MGEALYDTLLSGNDRIACRIYAPVGGYRDLLAYLVRRLLENGANSSFVAVAGDKNIPVTALLERPTEKLGLGNGQSARHSQIPMPLGLYGDRKNSAGFEFGHRDNLERLMTRLSVPFSEIAAHPLVPGATGATSEEAVLSPPTVPARSEPCATRRLRMSIAPLPPVARVLLAGRGFPSRSARQR